MGKQHVGAVAAVIAGFALARLFGAWAAGVLGAVGGHRRGADAAEGAVLVALPFCALAVFTLLRLARPGLLLDPVVRVALGAGWLVAGAVMGLLPYSRAGAGSGLHAAELHRAPGLLHGMDLALLAGLCLTVALLLTALSARPDRDLGLAEWWGGGRDR